MISLPKCHSTNDIALDMLKKKIIDEGSIVITDHQYSGRGQRGNVWISAPKVNLTFSVVLKPEFLKIHNHFYLNIITSLAIIDTLKAYLGPSFKIKWPNDIFCDDLKIAGILIENSLQSQIIESSIVGIGINVNQEAFDDAIKATSLKIKFNHSFKLNEILNRFILSYEKRYLELKRNSLDKLREEYLTYFYWIGEEHTFESDKSFQGIIKGIDKMGRLEIYQANTIKKYNFKEVKYIR